jgi:uncharacterized protein YggU (UPF0235/DUF167 family)
MENKIDIVGKANQHITKLLAYAAKAARVPHG